MRKKGMQVSLMTLIILIVTFIFLLMLAGQINDYLKKSNAREYCRLSIVSMEASKISGKQTVFNLDCPMQYIAVKDSNLPKDDAKKQGAVIKKVADAMYDCWYQGGKGEYTSLENELIGMQDVNCLLCSRINFKLEKPITVPLTEADAWLKKNSPAGSPMKYSEYLTYNGQQRYYYSSQEKELTTDSSYYIVLFTIRPKTTFENYLSLGANLLFNTNKGYSYVGVEKQENFNDLKCEALAN